MGNDGGSIPTRRELAKTAKQEPNTTEAKATLLESQTHKWNNCPLSKRPLSVPIVSDYSGILYNKDAILEFLLPSDDVEADKKEMDDILGGRVRSLKDVVQVNFQIERDEVLKRDKRICPITSKELGPATKAVYLVPCGHAFSELSIKEVGSDICMSCNEPYQEENAIPILPLLPEDISRLEARIHALQGRGLTHSLKKAAKEKKKKDKSIKFESTVDDTIKLENGGKKRALDEVPELVRVAATTDSPLRSGTATPTSGIKNAATASLTAKVMLEQEENNKRRKLALNSNLKSLYSNKGAAEVSTLRNGDFMTRGFSIPK